MFFHFSHILNTSKLLICSKGCLSIVYFYCFIELKDGATSLEKDTDDDYEDITTDSDDLVEEVDNLNLESMPKKHEKVSPRLSRSTVSGKRKKGSIRQEKSTARKKFWSLKLKGKLQVSKRSHYASNVEVCGDERSEDVCVCTSFKSKVLEEGTLTTAEGAEGGQIESHLYGENDTHNFLNQFVPLPSSSSDRAEAAGSTSHERGKGKGKIRKKDAPLPFINLNKLYPINDIDEQLIAQRRHEMEHGIDVEDVWILKPSLNDSVPKQFGSVTSIVCSTNIKKPVGQYPSYGAMALLSSEAGNTEPADLLQKQKHTSLDESLSCSTLNLNVSPWVPNVPQQVLGQYQVHTQVDYIHFLVPDLDKIVQSTFYWGVMDRYQAEKLIENKAEGTFLLRDSAQDEFLFSVSFRRYGRSLHARIEQWNHRFSFDSRDPGVFAANTVCGLIDHYKDPSCCMFFEPMLTLPLNRTFPFSLQHLARAAICSRITYDGITQLTLPRSLKEYLQFYHYKQKVRVRRFDNVS